MGGGASKAYYPGPSPQELELEQEQVNMMQQAASEQAAVNPILAQQAGYNYSTDPTTGAVSVTKMTPDQYYASLTPQEQQQYDIQSLANTQELQAMQGTLPIPADVQEQLNKQQAMETQQLYNQLGPGYATSTPGIQSQEALNEQQASILAGVQRGQETEAQAIGSTSQNELQQAQQNYMAGLESPIAGMENINQAMTIPISEYANQRAQQMQAEQFNAQQEQQANMARMSGISSNVMGGISMFA